MLHKTLFLALLLLMAGCQTPPVTPVAVDPSAAKLDGVILAGSTARDAGPEVIATAPVFSPTVTASYLGDARMLLEQAAKANGMVFTVTGPMPQLPIFVQINVKNASLDAFLEQVAHQLSQRADVVVRNKRKTIELRYRGVS